MPTDVFARDLSKPTEQGHKSRGRDFRAYHAFCEEILGCADSSEFYAVLPVEGRDLVAGSEGTSLEALFSLFKEFASEFKQTFF